MAKFVYDLVEKAALQATMQGGYVPRQDIVRLLGVASKELRQHFLGRSDERKPGPHVGLNRRATLALTPFLQRADYSDNPTGAALPLTDGVFTIPEGGYVSSYVIDGAKEIVEIDRALLNARLNDPICGPTPDYPIVTDVEDASKELYPKSITDLSVYFYGQVPEPTYEVTYDADSNEVYDDTTSVDVGWSRDHEPELLQRTLRLISQAIRDGQLSSTSGALTQDNS